MLSFIKETVDVWDMIKNSGKPIMMYGMGDGAIKIINVLSKYNLKVSEFFASDEFVRGHSFMGYKVRKLSEIEQMYDDFIVIMAFAIHDVPMTKRIQEIAKRHTLVAPDVPVAGENLFTLDFVSKNEDKIKQVYDMLQDEISKNVYSDIINFKISGKIDYLSNCETEIDEAYENVLKLSENEVYADLGAYKGETIVEFLNHTNGKCDGIVGFEPDIKNYKKLCVNMQEKNINGKYYNLAVHNKQDILTFAIKGGRNSSLTNKKGIEIKANSLDNIMCGERVSFINMDVEGAEHNAIIGATNTIKKYKPKMLISIYHRSEDIFEIPLIIKEINSEYKFYIRHYKYIPAWETNLYCI